MMTVAELIEALQALPPTSKVLLQRDEEGNGFKTLRGVDGDCIEHPSEDGEVLSASWTAGEACQDEDSWKKLLAGPRIVVLFP